MKLANKNHFFVQKNLGMIQVASRGDDHLNCVIMTQCVQKSICDSLLTYKYFFSWKFSLYRIAFTGQPVVALAKAYVVKLSASFLYLYPSVTVSHKIWKYF